MSTEDISDIDSPDLPSTGLRVDVATLIKSEVRQLMVDILHDRVGHAMALAAGPFFWRTTFTGKFGAAWGMNSREACDHLANVIFAFLQTVWRERYQAHDTLSPQQFLDRVHVPSPESDAERERQIEDSWRVEIASDEHAFQQQYHGSARVRTGRDAFSTFWQKPPKTRE